MTIKSYKSKISKVARLCHGIFVYFNVDHFDNEFCKDFSESRQQNFRSWVQTEFARRIITHWQSNHVIDPKTLAYQFDLLNTAEPIKAETPLWICRGVLLIYAYFNMPKAKATYLSSKLLAIGDVIFGQPHMFGCPLRENLISRKHALGVENDVVLRLNRVIQSYCEQHNISQEDGENGTPYAQIYRAITQGLLLGYRPSELSTHILKNGKGDFMKSKDLFRKYATPQVLEALTHAELDVIYFLERELQNNLIFSDALSYVVQHITRAITPKYRRSLFTYRAPFIVVAAHDSGSQRKQFQLLLMRNGELTPQLVDFDSAD